MGSGYVHSPNARLLVPLGLATLSLAMGGLLAAGHAAVVVVVVVGGAALGLTLHRPLLAIGVLFVAQELNPRWGFGANDRLLVFGHQIYFLNFASISVYTVLLAVAAISSSVRRGRLRVSGGAAKIAVALLLFIVLNALFHGAGLFSALNQNGRFLLLFLLAYAVAGGIEASSQATLEFAGGVLLVVVATGGTILYLTGHGQQIVGSPALIFYDAAAAAIAGAALLSIATTRRRLTRNELIVAASSLAIVVLSFRRGVWVGIAVAFVVSVVLVPGRGRLVLRYVTVLSSAMLALAVALPDLARTIVVQALSVLGPEAADGANAFSTSAHLEDLRIGWAAVRESPLGGIGPNGTLRGLFVQNGTLYVHNEYLQVWLRYGLAPLLLLVALLASLVAFAAKALRRGAAHASVRWAAFFVLLTPVAAYTAPYLSTTQRWPALLGFAGGLLAREFERRQTPPLAIRGAVVGDFDHRSLEVHQDG